MNIKQRIVLVIGGIVLALVIFITSETAQTSSEILEAANKSNTLSLEGIEVVYLLLKNDCIIAILRSVIVAALTFSAYIGFKSRD
jgi:hypothetical protein